MATDTVFAMIGDSLWEHIGKDKNSNWFKILDQAVTNVCAGLG
jgi:hypothetical protein